MVAYVGDAGKGVVPKPCAAASLELIPASITIERLQLCVEPACTGATEYRQLTKVTPNAATDKACIS